MFCPKCNFNNKSEARFCGDCGFALHTIAVEEKSVVQDHKRNPKFLTPAQVFKVTLGSVMLLFLVGGLVAPQDTNISAAVHVNPVLTLLWGIAGAWLIYSIFKIKQSVDKRS